jgi:hypothetical protein
MLKHNKKKNSLVLYEQLLTVITNLASSGNKSEASYLTCFIKENFSPRTETGKELKILKSLVSPCDSVEIKEKIIEEAIKQYKTVNIEKLESHKKYITETVARKLGKSFFSIPVKGYKMAASAMILLSESNSGYKFTSPEERVKLCKFLCERSGKKQEQETSELVDNFTFKILVGKFNEKYKSLNENQKKILSEWVNYQSHNDDKKFVDFLSEQKNVVERFISDSLKSKKHKDKEYYSMLSESLDDIKKPISSANQGDVYRIMQYFDLMQEMEQVS